MRRGADKNPSGMDRLTEALFHCGIRGDPGAVFYKDMALFVMLLYLKKIDKFMRGGVSSS